MNALTQSDPRADYLDWMRKHGVSYSAEFVPFSKSRNAKPSPKIADLCINWRVTFTCGGRAFSADYQQGIGHLPAHLRGFGRVSIIKMGEIRHAVDNGEARGPMGRGLYKKLMPPYAADVLDCLAMDAGVEDYRGFEDWVADFGYGPDGRSGERIYNLCRAMAADLRAVLPRGALDELRAIERL